MDAIQLVRAAIEQYESGANLNFSILNAVLGYIGEIDDMKILESLSVNNTPRYVVINESIQLLKRQLY